MNTWTSSGSSSPASRPPSPLDIARRHRPVKPRCDKQIYSKRDAQAMAKSLSRQRNRPIRAYYCERCNAWHLTKKPLREAP